MTNSFVYLTLRPSLLQMENYYFRKVCTWGGGNKVAYTHKKYKSGTAYATALVDVC